MMHWTPSSKTYNTSETYGNTIDLDGDCEIEIVDVEFDEYSNCVMTTLRVNYGFDHETVYGNEDVPCGWGTMGPSEFADRYFTEDNYDFNHAVDRLAEEICDVTQASYDQIREEIINQLCYGDKVKFDGFSIEMDYEPDNKKIVLTNFAYSHIKCVNMNNYKMKYPQKAWNLGMTRRL